MKFSLNLDSRSIRQYKNILLSLVYRGLSIVSYFLIVPICLSMLSSASYGTWLTIFSILGWTSFFDLGLSNGMKNKLSEALALDDKSKARKIVSTNYILLSVVALALILLFALVSSQIDWGNVLNAPKEELYINQLVFVCFTLSVVKLMLDSITSVLHAHQNVSVATLIALTSSLVSLAAIYALKQLNISQEYRLLYLGITIAGIPVIVMLMFNIYFFTSSLKHLRPTLSLFDRQYVRQIFALGSQFFVIQIAVLVINSTDSIIIARLFDPSQVTVYNIAFKLFSTFTIVWGIVITPYWTAFSEAYFRKEIPWIRSTMKLLLYLWLGLIAILLITVPLAPYIYNLWVGDSVTVPFKLSIGMALFIAISTFTNIFAYFVNGVAKVRMQLFTLIFAAIINIPLAIYFARDLNLGITGITIGTCVSYLLVAVILSIQYNKIIKSKARGIWNR